MTDPDGPVQKVLVTGGNGNLGRLVADRLAAQGARVIVFDLPGSPGSGRHAEVAGDIRDTDLLARTIEGHAPDAVIHLASLLSGSSEADPALAWAVNVEATVALMRLAADRVPGPFVLASTVATYGPGVPDPLPLDAPQWPETIYGVTKVAAERMGVYLAGRAGLDFRCLRFPQVLSPAAPAGALTAYPSHAVRAAIRGRPFTFPVSPQASVSNLFLLDVVASILGILKADRAALRHPAYNLHAYPLAAGELAEALRCRYPDFQPRFDPDPGVQALIDGCPCVIDSSAAEVDWDWRPGFDLEQSIAAMIEMIRGENTPP